jgi:predicted phage terminase large subunit-like protein
MAHPFHNLRNDAINRGVLGPTELNDALVCEKSLMRFTKRGWHNSGEPKEFQDNWHLDLLCDYFMAIARRQIKGPGPIIFTLPPQHMKSRLANVFLPAWVWAQSVNPASWAKGIRVEPDTLLGPGIKFAYISYGQDLSNDTSKQCRRLIESEWYQRRWSHQVKLNSALIETFANTAGGNRRAMSFSGGITGFHADYVFIDDAHNINSPSFEADRMSVIQGWDETLPSRLIDRRTSVFIIMMQRSAPNDLIGHILAKKWDGLHVCLPAEFEGRHPYVFLDSRWPVERLTDSSKGSDGGPRVRTKDEPGEPWRDFREEGDPLWPARFSKETLRQMQAGMTSHAAAGQYQQRPSAREGGMFKREWFANASVQFLPEEARKNMVRAWDLAATAEAPGVTPDWTVGLLMARDPATKIIYVVNIIRGRWSAGSLEELIKNTAISDGERVAVRIPQDPGASGKWLATNLVKLLQETQAPVKVDREDRNKAMRAEPFAAQCERGLVKIVQGPWNDHFIEELCAFTGLDGGVDDQVDAASGAYKQIAGRRGIIFG